MNAASRTSVDFMCMRDMVDKLMNVRVVSGIVQWVVIIEYSGQSFTAELDEYPDSNKVQQLIYAVAEYVDSVERVGRILSNLDIEAQS